MFPESEVDQRLGALDTSVRCKPNAGRGLAALLIPMRTELDSARSTTQTLRQKLMSCLMHNDYLQLEAELLDKLRLSIWYRSDCKQKACTS